MFNRTSDGGNGKGEERGWTEGAERGWMAGVMHVKGRRLSTGTP